jgi:hypothetical protein
MDTQVLERSIRRATFREIECWLTAEFGRSPNLPMLRISTPDSVQGLVTDQIYRAMLDYLFHWSLETLGYHLTHEELHITLIKIARRYNKVGVAKKRKNAKRNRARRKAPHQTTPPR